MAPSESVEESLASANNHTRRNLDPTRIPTLLDPKKLIALRNIRGRLLSSGRGNPNPDLFPPSYEIGNFGRICDTPLEAHYVVQIPN